MHKEPLGNPVEREYVGREVLEIQGKRAGFRHGVCRSQRVTPYVPRPQRGLSASKGFFRKDEFAYDTKRDAYTCRGGHQLKPYRFGKLREMTKIDYANKQACGHCPLRRRCTDAGYRAVSRLEHEDALRETVEHPFGTIKQWMNPGRVPNTRPRKGARRIQPDGARLQFTAGAQYPRHGQDDGPS